MKILHTIDSLNIGGIAEMMLNLYKFSDHEHAAWGYRGTMSPYMDEAGMKTFEGGPDKDDHYDIVVGHGVGGWSHDGVSGWGRERGMKVIEVMHSVAASITTPSSVDAFVPMSHLADSRNGHMPNRHVIYAPVDVDTLELGDYANPVLIGRLSRLAAEKDPMTFVSLAKQFPDKRFIIAGGGALEEQVRQQAPSNLKVLGMIRKFPIFYADLRLFVFPTIDETCCVSVAMAQAARVPVICSDIPALRETTGGYAIFCKNQSEFADAITNWQGDANDLVRTIQGYEWVREHFAPEVTVTAWDQLCESLL